MSDVITLDNVRRVAREVVQEFGEDFVYQPVTLFGSDGEEYTSCMYVEDGKPSCIVAQILTRLGVSLDDLKKYEGCTVYSMSSHLIPDSETRNYLFVMQREQDTCQTWGKSLLAAERSLVSDDVDRT